VEIRRYKNFAIYSILSFVASLGMSYLKCRWPWPRLLSIAGAVDIFWLFVVFYFAYFERDVRDKWDQTVKPILHLSLRVVLGLFVIVDLVFIFPEYSIEFLVTSSPLLYLRTLFFVSCIIGFTSVVAFSLGWATSIKVVQSKKGDLVRVLSNLVTAISFFGIIIAIFSRMTPTDLWTERMPPSFPREDLLGLFGQYASTLLYLSSICVGIGFVATGILMQLVSDTNKLVTFFLGAVFCLSIGFVMGYAIGPLVFFAVTEVAFAAGTMICIGLITCMLSRER
jgi:hypothetical protein